MPCFDLSERKSIDKTRGTGARCESRLMDMEGKALEHPVEAEQCPSCGRGPQQCCAAAAFGVLGSGTSTTEWALEGMGHALCLCSFAGNAEV